MAPNTPPDSPTLDNTRSTNFIQQIVEDDLRTGATGGRVVTRFPPEPNGYPHIGHAKSICLNFGLAADYGGVCHLRFDDTNPETEDMEYVEAIQRDVRWLGFDWGDHLYFASDYFEQLYDFAVQLIRDGKAYVDSLDEEQIREYRGTVTEPGRESPYRDRPVEENLDLFRRMKDGECADGEHVLRAKIDMASPNMLMRDPIMYRIRHAHHYRRGDAWCIYPMYDWAHGQSDAIEKITHSICTLEFEVHRQLYDWFVENLGLEPPPHQYEFARLSLDYTVTSKRKLLQLVSEGHVDGWDDPRMPTLAGLRRRGVTPEAIRAFCDLIGVARADSRVDIGMLEYAIRDDLNYRAPRVMCVLRPLKVVLTNYPEGREELLDASYWPHDIPREGSRPVPFSRELYIERDDFMEEPTKGFFRLAPGREVRLRHAYIIRCDEVVKDAAGEVVELRCTYDPETKSGGAASKRRVKGTLHWVSAAHALPAEVRLYDRLFSVPDPEDVDEGQTFKDHLNPDSIEVLTGSRIEPGVQHDEPGTRYQFERQGYFVTDSADSRPGALVFNRIITLRDTWAKIAEKSEGDGTTRAEPKSATVQTPAPPKAEPRERPPKPPALAARMARYVEAYGLPEDEADRLTADGALADFFEATIAAHANEQAASNWIVNELLGALKDRPLADLPFDGAALGALIALVDDRTISRRIAKDVFAEMLERGGDPRAIVDQKGLRQVTDADALAPVVEKVVAAFPDKVAEYRDGKTGLIGFFVGQAMRETSGKANPKLVKELVQKQLEG